jgi:hypothetical protein
MTIVWRQSHFDHAFGALLASASVVEYVRTHALQRRPHRGGLGALQHGDAKSSGPPSKIGIGGGTGTCSKHRISPRILDGRADDLCNMSIEGGARAG